MNPKTISKAKKMIKGLTLEWNDTNPTEEAAIEKPKISHSFISTQVRKRAEVRYECANGGPHGKHAFFMIGEPPAGVTQLQWLANCVSEFERIFSQFSN